MIQGGLAVAGPSCMKGHNEVRALHIWIHRILRRIDCWCNDMIAILLSPDRSEIVAPILDDGMYKYESFIGIDTGKLHYAAYLRTNQDESITEQKLAKMSRISDVAKMFAPSDAGHHDVIASMVRSMLACSNALCEAGYDDGCVVTVEDANKTRKE